MLVLVACLLCFCSALFAAGPTVAPVSVKPVTVVLDFEKPQFSLSVSTVQSELRSILRKSGLVPQIVLKSDLPPSPQLGELVIFKMKGSCTMEPVPLGALSDERGPLAMTYESDGQILSFGAVECDRVRQSLKRASQVGHTERPDSLFGRAVARVLAHEMYHMIANSSVHTPDGVTKESLSARDLSSGDMRISGPANAALRRGIVH